MSSNTPTGHPWDSRSADEIADDYVRLREKHGHEPHSRWILRIKELRVRHNLSILEAERMALSDPAWRRWAIGMMNSNQECRRSALSHIRYNGDDALIKNDGIAFSYRDET